MIEQEVIQAGVPTDLDFTLNQVVKVNCRCYKGKATVKGYNYSTDGYILETYKPTSARPHHNGLCKEGHALWCEASGLTPTKKWGEWIENTTGKCPEGLKRKQKVKLKWSDGDEFNITDPHDAAWYIDKGDGAVNITHYKVKLKDIAKDAPANDSKDKQNTDWQDNVLGLCPVPPNKVVEAKLQCGEILKWEAKDLNWGDTLSVDRKIVKWRLVD